MPIPDARRLTEIRERLERATKAPWIVNVWTSGRYTVENGNGLAIAEVHPVHEEGGQRANAHLLANAPADIRDLLERVEKLESSVREFLALRQSIIDVGGAAGPLPDPLITKFAEMQQGVVERAESALKGGS